MKNTNRPIILVMLLLAASSARANIVGYVNVTFQPGNTLFANALLGNDDHIDALFPTANIGDTISLWNSTTLTYNPVATFDYSLGPNPNPNGEWVNENTLQPLNLLLDPGTGALYNNTGGLFTNTFVGNVLNHDGSPASDPLTDPPPYSGPAGLFLLADKAPTQDIGTNIFLHIFGRNPNVGEKIITSPDPINSPSSVYTYDGNGVWDYNGTQNITPQLNPGQSAFFNILVPEPSAMALAALGLGLLALRRRPGR
jgi:hypothetical protein